MNNTNVVTFFGASDYHYNSKPISSLNFQKFLYAFGGI